MTPKSSRSSQVSFAKNREFSAAYKATHGPLLDLDDANKFETSLDPCSAKRSGKQAPASVQNGRKSAQILRNPCRSIFPLAVEMFLFHSFLQIPSMMHHVGHRSVCAAIISTAKHEGSLLSCHKGSLSKPGQAHVKP